MILRCLLLEVHVIGGRYHGQGDWPPSPFRVFQALVAGAYGGRWAAESDAQRQRKDAAFEWLEQCDAPAIASPHARKARGVSIFVPNNDLDSVGGDPARIAEIRGSRKVFAPHLFDCDRPFVYAWPFAGDDVHALALCEIADRMHTLGYGIDAAFARAEVVEWVDAESRLHAHGGPISRAGSGAASDAGLRCPAPGSLRSLHERQRSGALRFHARDDGRAGQTFRKAPTPVFRSIEYGQPATYLLFDLRRADGDFHVLAIERAAELAIAVRDRALWRLLEAFPDRAGELERVVKGSRESTDADKAQRLRFYALPSVGHMYADKGLRRVTVEIPPQCPLRANDVAWALSGQHLSADPRTGEIVNDLPALVHAEDRSMLAHYGLGELGTRHWRSVTPMVIPARRRRARDGRARVDAERNAIAAIRAALRHAGLSAQGVGIRVQREPFLPGIAPAAAFALDRFGPQRLVHVELSFDAPRGGPLALGDGRFLGLGLFAPDFEPPSIYAFAVRSAEAACCKELARALRRAVMARVRDALGLRDRQGLPKYFGGHEQDGSPSNAPGHAHLYFVSDAEPIPRLLVVAPHRVRHRTPSRDEFERLQVLDRALTGFAELRAGAGQLRLEPLLPPEGGDSLIGPSRVWESVTDYRPTRHPKPSSDLHTWLTSDALTECKRSGLPRPTAEIVCTVSGPRGGLTGRLRLAFEVAVSGPILLGRDAHFGGGLFRAAADSAAGTALRLPR